MQVRSVRGPKLRLGTVRFAYESLSCHASHVLVNAVARESDNFVASGPKLSPRRVQKMAINSASGTHSGSLPTSQGSGAVIGYPREFERGGALCSVRGCWVKPLSAFRREELTDPCLRAWSVMPCHDDDSSLSCAAPTLLTL